MPRTLGLIGSGLIGTSLAHLAVAAGMNVVLSNSRGPDTLADLVTSLGDGARAATPDEAARAGDLVVVTIPLRAYDRLPVAALRGKTVLDTMNYYPQRDGRLAELDSHELTSSSLVQRHLAGSRLGHEPWNHQGYFGPVRCHSCGSQMRFVAAVASIEWDGGTASWAPAGSLEGPVDSRLRHQSPTGVRLAGTETMRIFTCPVSPEHPVISDLM